MAPPDAGVCLASARAAAALDAIAVGPLLVIGSLPGAGRDVDVLATDEAMSAIEPALLRHGFVTGGGSLWARFGGLAEPLGATEIIDLTAASSWRLPTLELDALFGDSVALDGYSSLRVPSPARTLLALAKRLQSGEPLSARALARAREAASQPGAAASARDAASSWGVGRELERVLGARRAARRPLRARARGARRGALIAFSGLDGSGKSTQAQALERALTDLGYPTARVWTSLTAHPSLERVARPVKAAARLARVGRGERSAPPPSEPRTDPASVGPEREPLAEALRTRLPLLGRGWILYVSLANAWWQARVSWPQIARGRIVVCDRWTLDSQVQLRYRYGDRRYTAELGAIQLASPRPLRTYLLAVTAPAAYARNQEYNPAQVQRRCDIYDQECERLGARRLDGERTAAALHAEIAADVWLALRGR